LLLLLLRQLLLLLLLPAGCVRCWVALLLLPLLLLV
jgi:hypothetical protein